MSKLLNQQQIKLYWDTPDGWKTAEGIVAIQNAILERAQKNMKESEKVITKQKNINRNKRKKK